MLGVQGPSRAAVRLVALVALAASASAQPDSLRTAGPPAVVAPALPVVADGVVADSARVRTPRGAVTRALLAPGLGQIYNGETLKAPLAVALVVGAVGYAVNRQRQYLLFRRATAYAGCRPGDLSSVRGDPDTSPERFDFCTASLADDLDEWQALGSASFSTLQPIRETARGQRDVAFLLVGVAYGLQALDAFIAAHLADFDVSDDLSLRVLPARGRPEVSLRLGL